MRVKNTNMLKIIDIIIFLLCEIARLKVSLIMANAREFYCSRLFLRMRTHVATATVATVASGGSDDDVQGGVISFDVFRWFCPVDEKLHRTSCVSDFHIVMTSILSFREYTSSL